jgi:hypothetical protein
VNIPISLVVSLDLKIVARKSEGNIESETLMSAEVAADWRWKVLASRKDEHELESPLFAE